MIRCPLKAAQRRKGKGPTRAEVMDVFRRAEKALLRKLEETHYDGAAIAAAANGAAYVARVYRLQRSKGVDAPLGGKTPEYIAEFWLDNIYNGP